MKLTLSGGTDQQRAWVNEAIGMSSYPYAQLDADVTVQWSSTNPCALFHSYMCTQQTDTKTFTVTIQDWADDPNNQNLAGLPDPQSDIKDFYMQSFVHELGHVAHKLLITTDENKTKAAGLFWTNDLTGGSGVRYGKLADYSHDESSNIEWGYAIIEAIAECVKCACYKGRLIFMNRTFWNIDEGNWAALWELILPRTGRLMTYKDDFPNPDPAVTQTGGGSTVSWSTPGNTLDFEYAAAPGGLDPGVADHLTTECGLVVPFIVAVHVESAGATGPGDSGIEFAQRWGVVVDVGSKLSDNTALGMQNPVEFAVANGVDPGAFDGGSPPCWIGVWVQADNSWTKGIWQGDKPPAIGSTPDTLISSGVGDLGVGDNPFSPDQAYLAISPALNARTAEAVVDSFIFQGQCAGGLLPPPAYPFGNLKGKIDMGPFAFGVI